MNRSRHFKVLFALAICVAAWFVLRRIDWSGPPSAPAEPVSLHNDTLREFHFRINGVDPSEHKVHLASGERFLIDAAYTREPAAGQVLDQIVLALVYDDGSETGKIDTSSVLAPDLELEEHRTTDGLVQWRSKQPRGATVRGQPRSFTARPGTYELRLCWKREPKTAAELAAEHEDPFRFLHPFYRAEIEITPRVPRKQQQE